MSKNSMRQHHDVERDVQRELNDQEQELLSLFNQLSEADRQHIVRLMHALRDTSP